MKNFFRSTTLLLLIPLLALPLLAASCTDALKIKKKSSGGDYGVLKSANGGADWQGSNAVVNTNGVSSLASFQINHFAIDATQPDVLYAASVGEGVYQTKNAGATWTRLLSQLTINDIVVDTKDNKKIYAAGIAGDHGRVVATTDGGQSWNEIFNEASTKNPVQSIALNPNDSNHLLLGTSYGALVETRDAGKTWKQLVQYNDKINRILWVSSGLYVVAQKGGVYRSTDQGVTFQDISSTMKPANTPQSKFSFNKIREYYDIAIAGNTGVLYVITKSGVFKSTTNGTSWEELQLPAKNETLVPGSIATSSDGSNVYVSYLGAVYRSIDSGVTWQVSNASEKMTVKGLAVSQTNPAIVFAGLTKK